MVLLVVEETWRVWVGFRLRFDSLSVKGRSDLEPGVGRD